MNLKVGVFSPEMKKYGMRVLVWVRKTAEASQNLEGFRHFTNSMSHLKVFFSDTNLS